MAEYRDRYESIRAAGADFLALSVDEPARAEAVRQQLHLPFFILCDTEREVVRAWGLYNPREMGGIAKPAVFVLAQDRQVLLRSVDTDAARVPADAVLDFLRRESAAPADYPPPRKFAFPRPGDVFRAIRNALRYGTRSPKA